METRELKTYEFICDDWFEELRWPKQPYRYSVEAYSFSEAKQITKEKYSSQFYNRILFTCYRVDVYEIQIRGKVLVNSFEFKYSENTKETFENSKNRETAKAIPLSELNEFFQ